MNKKTIYSTPTLEVVNLQDYVFTLTSEECGVGIGWDSTMWGN